MWGRLKSLFFGARKAEPPKPEPAAIGPPGEPAQPATSPAGEGRKDPLLTQSDALFLEARQLAHSLKLEATIGISNVQQRYKVVRHAQGTDPRVALRALHEPIVIVYSEQLGRELLFLAFTRSLRRKFHRIVADALDAGRSAAAGADVAKNQVYHLTRAGDLSAATKLCLDEAKRARERGDAARADQLCVFQVELLLRQINVRVPLDEPVAKAAVYQWMGFVYQSQGKAEEADKAFHQADEISPPQEEYRDPIAEALGDWRTVDLDELPEGEVPVWVPPPEPTRPADDLHGSPLAIPARNMKTASEMLRVDLPEPPDIFQDE